MKFVNWERKCNFNVTSFVIKRKSTAMCVSLTDEFCVFFELFFFRQFDIVFSYSLGPASNSIGSLSFVASPSGTIQTDRACRTPGHGVRAGSAESGRRDSRDSWHTLQSNMQSSGVQKRVSPSKQVSVGMIRHDEATGVITLDIRNMPNGDPGKLHIHIHIYHWIMFTSKLE